MNRLALLVLLAACERQAAPPETRKDKPVEPNPDPVKQARAAFEIVDQDLAAGTSKLYSHGDFLENSYSEEAFDQGEFTGRLRTLFGVQPGDEYVLRHKATGFVITAYSGSSGPSLGGSTPANDDGIDKRIAADPILKAGSPMERMATAKTDAERTELWKQVTTYQRHMDDARAPVGFPAVASELEKLMSAVKPADWETTRFDEDSNTVYKVGAREGESFNEELEPEVALAFLLDRAEKQDPADRDALGGIPWMADSHVLFYWDAHRDQRQFAARVRASWERLARAAKSYDKDLRASLSDEVRQFATKLRIPAATVTAALK